MKIIEFFKKLAAKLKEKLGFASKNNYINYLSNGESLPKPYTKEEEQQKIEMLLSGEEEVRGDLIEHNLRLVVYIAR